MLDAMLSAEVGDDVYGEDATVNALEGEVARLLGKAAALFVPSGTMANQLAIAAQTRPGDSVVTEQDAHCFLFEAGGAGALSGVQFDLVPLDERLADAAIERSVKPESLHLATTSMLVVENTHNVGGGRVLAPFETQRITAKGKALGLATHCDGARLWNAAVALDTTERALAEGFDTLAVCFSKGLGAPVGSALVGSAPVIARARKLRKRWGGGMRQAGYIAAGALHALRHHRARLADDHRLAGELAQTFRSLEARGAPIAVRYPDPGTNMVYFKLERGAAEAHVRRLADAGLLVGTIAGGWIRAVVHLDVGTAEVERLAAGVTALVQAT
jgi:threonine aldolase